MPKLTQDRREESQRRIESAALALFTKQGFHGTNIRQIAKKAEVSTGAIYTYYPTKESLFVAIVRKYERRMRPLRDQMFGTLEMPFSQGDLKKIALQIQSNVYDNLDYWRLMYIDVVEFNNRHFAPVFQGFLQRIRRRLGPRLNEAKREEGWCGKDPAFVFASMYMYIFEYFLIEKLFQGNRHLGVSDEQAIDSFIELFLYGVWSGAGRATQAQYSVNSLGQERQKERQRAYSR